jgi:hypothetical protein
MAEWLLPITSRTTYGLALALALVEELLRRQVVPPVAAIERLCADVFTHAQRQVFEFLITPPTTSNELPSTSCFSH